MSEIQSNKDNEMGALKQIKAIGGASTEHFQTIAIELKKLSTLKTNWNDFGSEAPSASALALAHQFLKYFQQSSFAPKHVGPSVENGVGFTFENGKKFGYIEILNSGEVLFLIDTAGLNRDTWEVNAREESLLTNSIQRIKNHLIG